MYVLDCECVFAACTLYIRYVNIQYVKMYMYILLCQHSHVCTVVVVLDSYLICTVLYNYYFDLYIVSYNENIQLNFSNAVDFYLFFILSP